MRRLLDAFALATYRMVFFPKVLGHVEVAIVDLFDRLKRNMHSAPAILAEIIRALNACQKNGQGRFFGSTLLFYIWARSHF